LVGALRVVSTAVPGSGNFSTPAPTPGAGTTRAAPGIIERELPDLRNSSQRGKTDMNRVPDAALVLIPGGTLLTKTAEEGRKLALTLARQVIHNIQPDLDVLKAGREQYAKNPDSLIAAGQVVAIEFQTIAAANNYWR
jgi:Hexameric tyrosine-coordinated heme protein (HTHP)